MSAIRRNDDGAPLWERYLLGPARAFLESVLRLPPTAGGRATTPRRSPSRPRRFRAAAVRGAELEADLYLTSGTSSLKLFGAGPIDELAFFQRFSVGERHDVEYVTRLHPEDAGTEDYRGYAMFRLARRRAQPVPTLDALDDVWEALAERGLDRLPPAKKLIARRFTGYDPDHGSLMAGRKRVDPPRRDRPFARVGEERVGVIEVLDLIRSRFDPLAKLAWIEEAYPDRPAWGQVVHRYYLAADGRLLLVRDHFERGKALFEADLAGEHQAALRRAA